jgi:hypothetical protein
MSALHQVQGHRKHASDFNDAVHNVAWFGREVAIVYKLLSEFPEVDKHRVFILEITLSWAPRVFVGDFAVGKCFQRLLGLCRPEMKLLESVGPICAVLVQAVVDDVASRMAPREVFHVIQTILNLDSHRLCLLAPGAVLVISAFAHVVAC